MTSLTNTENIPALLIKLANRLEDLCEVRLDDVYDLIARARAAAAELDSEPTTQDIQDLLSFVHAFGDLVASSDGVAGLHLNGDIAYWESLMQGGRFESWLASYSAAHDVLARFGGGEVQP